jgi:hypothetical protein
VLRASGFLSKGDDHVDGSISEHEYTLHDCVLREEGDVLGFFELDWQHPWPLLQVQGSLSRAGSDWVKSDRNHSEALGV